MGRHHLESDRITVIGAGPRFLSGMSYYTLRLTNALASRHHVSAILMRQLIPSRWYPGRSRIGAPLTAQRYAHDVKVLDGVDWYWLPSMLRAIRQLIAERPTVVLFQWWTGSVLHSYVLLALVARALGARIVVEFHEVLDTAEANMPVVGIYVRLVSPLLMRLADGFVVHSKFDLPDVRRHYALGRRPVSVIPHGPYDHHRPTSDIPPMRSAPAGAVNLLYLGVIRPFKGVEDLVAAFDGIPPDEINRYWLTVVGETWENWSLPGEMIHRSRYRDRITFVNRYVSDDELTEALAGADAVVLPYHRSSASGPLHTAMSLGLPVVVTAVGGLPEAAGDYEGAIFVPPRDPERLRSAIAEVAEQRGRRYPDPHSWDRTVARYEALFQRLGRARARAGPGAAGDARSDADGHQETAA